MGPDERSPGAPAARAGSPGSGADDPTAFYTAGYSLADRDEGLRMGRWRALGARTKAAHARALSARAGVRPQRVVEIGCGDGSLLLELAAVWPDATFDGFELSPPAIEIARGRGLPRAGRLEAYDGARVPAGEDAYDLAVLSHVLEHVPDPAPLLAEAARVAPRVLVEVPLEDNRSAARPAKREEAARIGHLHAFNRGDVRALVAGAGLRVLAELSDPLPREHHAFFAQSGKARAAAAAKWAVRAAAWRAAPLRAETLFTVHYAALAGRA
jgi:SAM-dependent methyltransferase